MSLKDINIYKNLHSEIDRLFAENKQLKLYKVHKMNYKERVIEEKDKLVIKADKLKTFINTVDFNDIDELEQDLLPLQLNAMEVYIGILYLRIDKF